MTQQPTELRPMGVGDIFDVIFRMYRSRFVPFLMIALIAYIPYGIALGLMQQSIAEAAVNPSGELNVVVVMTGVVLAFLFSVVVMALCQGAMLHQISAAYLGTPIGAAESYRRALPRLGRLLLANLVVGVIIAIGFVLLIVPGVIFSLWFMLISAVVMVESHGAMKSMSRSKELMAGNLGKGMLVGFVIAILAVVIGAVGGMLIEFLPAESFLLESIADTLIQAVVLPVQVGALVLFYYDLRIRKEAFDLEQLATQLNQEAPVAVPGPQPPLAQ